MTLEKKMILYGISFSFQDNGKPPRGLKQGSVSGRMNCMGFCDFLHDLECLGTIILCQENEG